MRILITNDDGFDAAGIKSLKKIALAMSTEDKVFVVAPAQNQSAKSRSVSYKTAFNIKKKNTNEYSVEGTPTDCIIFALEHLMKKEKPDICRGRCSECDLQTRRRRCTDISSIICLTRISGVKISCEETCYMYIGWHRSTQRYAGSEI